MAKTIFILGCGIMQIPALKIAKQSNWHVIAADGNPNAPGRVYCDEFFPVDLTDIPGLIAHARRIRNGRGPDGVFTAGTDFSLSVSKVAESLGLPGHSVESARRATNKVLMRKTFQDANTPSPPFAEITKEKNLDFLLTEIPGPWVVKPVDSMGARGVIRIDKRTDLDKAVETARSYSRSRQALLETYMEGPEFSLDALVEDGRFIPCGMADRIIQYPPYFIEMGHSIPSAVSDTTAKALWDVFEQGVKALGLSRGGVKGDLKLTSNGAMIGEIAARLSGGYMSGWTWPAASGVEPTQGALRLAVGLDAGNMTPTQNRICTERALICIDGTIAQLSGREEAVTLPGVQDVFLRYRPGDTVVFPRNNVEKIGNVITVGHTLEEAQLRAMATLKKLSLILEPYNSATARYLDSFDNFPPDVFDVGNFFYSLWKTYPPKPSLGCSRIKPKVATPLGLPESYDYTGRTIHDILIILNDEKRIVLTDGEDGSIEGQEAANFWRALIRGGLQGLRWYLDSTT